jgi:hypothetical protein
MRARSEGGQLRGSSGVGVALAVHRGQGHSEGVVHPEALVHLGNPGIGMAGLSTGVRTG